MTAPKNSPRGVFGAIGAFLSLSTVAGVLAAVGATPTIAATGILARNTIGIFDSLPEYLTVDRLAQPTNIYAKGEDGGDVLLATFYAQNRQPVTYDQIARSVKDATIAAEDVRFYRHGGVDLEGTARGILSTVKGDLQGGSSITQQYVKNVLLQKCEAMGVKTEADQKEYETCVEDATGTSIERKLREMRYAIGIEKKYSKDQILAGYLNIAGFGGSVYGIQSAAHYYFGVDAGDLTAAQAASLVAIVNNPAKLKLDDPGSASNGAENGYAANKVRRDHILNTMLEEGFLTAAQHAEAIATPIEPRITPTARGCQTAGDAAFFCDYVQKVALNDPAFGADADTRAANFYRGGYKIYSTLDLSLQNTAQDAVRSRIPATYDRAALGGAAVGVQPGTGRVLFMTQSKDYSQDPSVLGSDPRYTAINWNTDRQHGGSNGFQVGSTYKVFTLAEWLSEGKSLNDTVDANVRTFNQASFTNSCGASVGSYRPTNDVAGQGGRRSVLNATVNSINTAYVSMAYQLDLCKIKDRATSFGVHSADGSPLNATPASVLGTNTIAPLTMATAYAGIANNGVVCSPVPIDRVLDNSGKEITPPQSHCSEAVTPSVAAGMAYALRQVMTNGTAAAANPGGSVEVLAKTGTTDNAEQLWLVASSTKVTTAFWTGNTVGHTSLRTFSVPDSSGHRMQASLIRNPVVRDIMSAANAKYGGDSFSQPSAAILKGAQVVVPDLSGKSAEEARSLLEGLGLGYADGGAIDSALPTGRIVSSAPSAGSSVTKGSVVTVLTSNAKLTTMPDVVGMTLEKAIAALRGFPVATNGGSGSLSDVVTATNPSAGASIPPSSTVTLTLRAAPAPEEGD
jgi:membrane peptidoglycan carboxypeptidase